MNTYQLFCVVSIKFNATAINCKQLLSDFTITIMAVHWTKLQLRGEVNHKTFSLSTTLVTKLL
jgi:hypothetical protein